MNTELIIQILTLLMGGGVVQFDINTKLRQELDEKNTRIAVFTLLRCKKLKCIDREPPYGSEINEEIEQ